MTIIEEQVVKTQVKKKICNLCGKELTDIFDIQEEFGFHSTIGYGSKYDLMTIDLDLCCDCFDKLMDQLIPMCKINPISYNGEAQEI